MGTRAGFWKGGFRVLILKNPGNRVGLWVFKNESNWRFLAEKIATLALFGQKIARFYCFLVHKMESTNIFSEFWLILLKYQFLKKISYLSIFQFYFVSNFEIHFKIANLFHYLLSNKFCKRFFQYLLSYYYRLYLQF